MSLEIELPSEDEFDSYIKNQTKETVNKLNRKVDEATKKVNDEFDKNRERVELSLRKFTRSAETYVDKFSRLESRADLDIVSKAKSSKSSEDISEIVSDYTDNQNKILDKTLRTIQNSFEQLVLSVKSNPAYEPGDLKQSVNEFEKLAQGSGEARDKINEAIEVGQKRAEDSLQKRENERLQREEEKARREKEVAERKRQIEEKRQRSEQRRSKARRQKDFRAKQKQEVMSTAKAKADEFYNNFVEQEKLTIRPGFDDLVEGVLSTVYPSVRRGVSPRRKTEASDILEKASAGAKEIERQEIKKGMSWDATREFLKNYQDSDGRHITSEGMSNTSKSTRSGRGRNTGSGRNKYTNTSVAKGAGTSQLGNIGAAIGKAAPMAIAAGAVLSKLEQGGKLVASGINAGGKGDPIEAYFTTQALNPLAQIFEPIARSIDDGLKRMASSAETFSPELIAVGIDKQLMLMEYQIEQAEKYGDTLADLEVARNDASMELRRLTDEIIITFAPTLIEILEILKEVFQLYRSVVEATKESADVPYLGNLPGVNFSFGIGKGIADYLMNASVENNKMDQQRRDASSAMSRMFKEVNDVLSK